MRKKAVIIRFVSLEKITLTRLKRFSVDKRDLYVDNIDNVVKIDNMNKSGDSLWILAPKIPLTATFRG